MDNFSKDNMKNSVVFAFQLVFVLHLSAQLPSGAQAPDFTATDLNGQTWHLYDLLESGKIVILEVGATWCQPCWAYHSSGVMQDLYEEHGPQGDGRLQVLYVEGDPHTNLDCLHGLPGCNGYTPGDYTAGIDYPIFDNAAIADSFQVNYFPTLFVICPNKKLYEVNPVGAEALWEEAQKCPVASGTNNAGIFQYSPGTDLREICGTQNLSPSFNLVNLGSATLESATIELKWNNSTVQTMNWYGSLPVYGETPITLDAVPTSGAGTLRTQIVSVNGGSDDDASNNLKINNFTAAPEFSSQQVILKIRTDNYAIETYWELRDDQGNVLDHGGNENVGPNGGNVIFDLTPGVGTYPNNALIKDTLALPVGGCYSLHFVDAYGDGMCCNFGNGYYKLYNIDNPVVPIMTGDEFAANDNRRFGALSNSVAVGEATESFNLEIYPNPASDQLFMKWEMLKPTTVQGAVYNALGECVYRFENNQKSSDLQILTLNGWTQGMYWLELRAEDERVVRKFLIQQ